MRDFKKNISNKDAEHSRTRFINKDVEIEKSKSARAEDRESVIDKGMTTKDLPGFVGTSEGNELIKDKFRSKPLIIRALKGNAGLTYVNQIPNALDALVAIKGIAEKSANYILEELS